MFQIILLTLILRWSSVRLNSGIAFGYTDGSCGVRGVAGELYSAVQCYLIDSREPGYRVSLKRGGSTCLMM
jgi:hypothetical protein